MALGYSAVNRVSIFTMLYIVCHFLVYSILKVFFLKKASAKKDLEETENTPDSDTFPFWKALLSAYSLVLRLIFGQGATDVYGDNIV